MSRVFIAVASATLLAMPASAVAAPTIFSGFDEGAAGPGANATAAATAFDAAVTSATVETFEGFTTGDDTNGLGGLNYTIGSVGFDIRNATTCGNVLCGNNTTLGGVKFAYSNIANASLTFNFTNAVNAFGAYFGGLQTSTNALKWTDANGSYSVPLNPQASGGYAFVGFYDPSTTVTSVTIDIPFDLISVDDVRSQVPRAGVAPEPPASTILFLGFGVVGGSLRAKRSRLALRLA